MKTYVHLYNISPNSSCNEKCSRHHLQRKSKHTFYVQQIFIKNSAFYEVMWKNILGEDRPQMTI
jgi:hypothetical protein